jgi:hypothetical protein
MCGSRSIVGECIGDLSSTDTNAIYSLDHLVLSAASSGCNDPLRRKAAVAKRKVMRRVQQGRRALSACPHHCAHSEGIALQHTCLEAMLLENKTIPAFFDGQYLVTSVARWPKAVVSASPVWGIQY